MSLKKKIIISFFIGAFIIALNAGFEYINFIKIRREIRFLEITDTVRSKSLELRRHEKNFLLRADTAEITSVHEYLSDLKAIFGREQDFNDKAKLLRLKEIIDEYEYRFNLIEGIYYEFQKELDALKPSHTRYSMFFPLIESTFLERPIVNSDLLEEVFLVKPDNPAVRSLRDLSKQIEALRKNGEELIIIADALDRMARAHVDSFITASQLAIFAFFFLFVIVGVVTFLLVISNVVKRLQTLTDVVEKAGKGYFTQLDDMPRRWVGDDEVGILIRKFNVMEQQLEEREKELLQSKKLAAIGTLASGIAHELNNPLNNIYTTAQRLMKKAERDCPIPLKKGLDDIFGQAMRVKQIVSDLLEFARGREPQLKEVELVSLLRGVYKKLGNTLDTGKIEFVLESERERVTVNADPVQIEQVFINLFMNAVEAMTDGGTLKVKVQAAEGNVTIEVADSGAGMPTETVDKIFEPFYTTKDKGTGLGLAIIFNIIQKHNGGIRVESKEGGGTIFTITFPGGKE